MQRVTCYLTTLSLLAFYAAAFGGSTPAAAAENVDLGSVPYGTTGQLRLEEVATLSDNSQQMIARGDRLYFALQGGQVEEFAKQPDGSLTNLPGVFLDVAAGRGGTFGHNPVPAANGLRGIAFHPAFESNGKFYSMQSERRGGTPTHALNPGWDNDAIYRIVGASLVDPPSILGDLDLDGDVTEADVAAFVDGWLAEFPTARLESWQRGDLNLDARTDLADAYLMHEAVAAAGFSVSLRALTRVPEPATLACLLLGSWCSVLLRAPRRRQSPQRSSGVTE